MNILKKKSLNIALFIFFLIIMVCANSCNCVVSEHPIYDLIIENQTNATLNIYTNNLIHFVGQVEPGETIDAKYDTHSLGILIEAKNVKGELFFSETFSFSSKQFPLQKLDNLSCKAIITSLKQIPESIKDTAGSHEN